MPSLPEYEILILPKSRDGLAAGSKKQKRFYEKNYPDLLELSLKSSLKKN